jgi:hypothetical protein
MKRLSFTLAIFLFAAFTTSCEEIFEEDEANVQSQYFACQVRGKHIDMNINKDVCGALVFNYFPEAVDDISAGFLQMGVEQCDEVPSIVFTFQGVNADYTGTSALEALDFANSLKPSVRLEDGSDYKRFIDGVWRVTRFSSSTKKEVGTITGTFEMRLLDLEKSDTLLLKDGQFNFVLPRLRE